MRTEQYQRANTHQLFWWDQTDIMQPGAIFVGNICCYNNSVCAFNSYFNDNDIIDLWIGDYNGTFHVGVIKLYYCPPTWDRWSLKLTIIIILWGIFSNRRVNVVELEKIWRYFRTVDHLCIAFRRQTDRQTNVENNYNRTSGVRWGLVGTESSIFMIWVIYT